MKSILVPILASATLFAGCEVGDDSGSPDRDARHFTLTIENIGPQRAFTSAGVFNTPAGDSGPGAATPGKSYQFSIHAGRKQKLSFVAMLAATNDLFYGPDGDGIALYDDQGNPISGDVTDQVYLWDAGTEVNQEPKVGSNTVSKQAGPDTGPAENGDVLAIGDVADDTFAYPAVADVIDVSIAHVAGTEFLVTIANVSAGDALKTSEGDFPAPVSPGVWVVHSKADPLFSVGMPDRGEGIEHIAEDGNPTDLAAATAALVGVTYPASPGVWAVHADGSRPFFTEGQADYGDGIEAIAEDGNPTMLGSSVGTLEGVIDGDVFNTPVGSDGPGAIVPGLSYQVSFDAMPGDALSFATMLAATNDVFFAPGELGIALFDDAGMPVTGDVTSLVQLWDTGSEANEEPALGPNTVTNQFEPNTGEAGEGIVQRLSDVAGDSYAYPSVGSLLQVSLEVE